jgi:CBS domain containing-hemolysin-like protein
MMKFFLNSPKAGIILISGLGINLSWLFLLPWSWSSVVTLMMTAIILKMCFNRHAVKKHITYDISLMASACMVTIALTYVLTQSLGMSPAAASVMAPLWAWVAMTLLFIKMIPKDIQHEFALGYKPG